MAEPEKLGAGSTCPKCPSNSGSLTLLQYVRNGNIRTNPSCYGCPVVEHLHVSCTICGFTIVTFTADNPSTGDLSAATPIPAMKVQTV